MKFIKFLFFAIILSCCTFLKVDNSFAYDENKVLNFEKLNKEIIRFHVIANSDSIHDQNIKLKVKDGVLEFLNRNYDFSSDKLNNIIKINSSLNDVKKVAEKILKVNGEFYDVDVKLEKKYFEDRNYEGYVVPEGIYDSFVIYLGEAKGKNFWSMIFSGIGFIHDKNNEMKNKSMINLINYNKNFSREVFSNDDKRRDEGVKISFKLFEVVRNVIKKIF